MTLALETMPVVPRSPLPDRDLEAAVSAMTAAGARFMAPDRAEELSRNVAMALAYDDENARPSGVVRSQLLHRMRHFGLRCWHIEACVSAMARAWRESR